VLVQLPSLDDLILTKQFGGGLSAVYSVPSTPRVVVYMLTCLGPAIVLATGFLAAAHTSTRSRGRANSVSITRPSLSSARPEQSSVHEESCRPAIPPLARAGCHVRAMVRASDQAPSTREFLRHDGKGVDLDFQSRGRGCPRSAAPERAAVSPERASVDALGVGPRFRRRTLAYRRRHVSIRPSPGVRACVRRIR
jgi:hypothetical protein